MGRKIVTYDELTDTQKIQAISLQTAAFGGSEDEHAVRLLRERGGCMSDYFGMFAIEGGEVIGEVIVYRLDYTFPGVGTMKVSGLAGITTRADRSRGGVARDIICQVHEAEKRAGMTHSILWTNSSWHAHDLYARLGYRDIFSSPIAFRAVGKASPRPNYSFVRATKSDLSTISEVHASSTAGGTGFVHRPAGLLPVLTEIGSVPLKNIYLVKREGRTSGYLYREGDGSVLRCREFAVLSGESKPEILSAIESKVRKGGVAMFRDVLTAGTAGFFRENGYTVYPSQWKVLMGTRLDAGLDQAGAIREFGTARDDFMCSAGDGF